jgi:D-aspartate ligase
MGFDLRHFHSRRPPALLLGGVNLVRAAGLGGIPAIVASCEPDAPAAASRYAHGSLLLPPLENRDAVLETLVRAGERLADALGSKVPLLYGGDDFLNLIQQNHGALAPHFALILNDAEVAHALIDKDRFEAFGRRRGLPVPRTLQWEELDGWYAPLLVKPKVKIGFDDSASCRRLFGAAGKARVFASGPEFSAMALARQMREQVVLQEYIPGDDRNIWSFHGYADEHGKLLASFVGRKIRTDPPLVGMSSYLELAHDDAFAAVGHHVAARAGLKGVFKIDFKQNAVTGAWRVLEINARFNLWHHLAARNGLNLPRIAYDYLLYGKRPATQAYRTDWRWLALRHDYRAYRALAARGELGAWAWLRSILEAPKVYELFSWSDPLPFVRRLVTKASRIPRLTLRLKRWLFTAS